MLALALVLVASLADPSITEEAAESTTVPTPPVSAGYDGGFFVASPDGRYRLRFRALTEPHFSFQATELGIENDTIAFAIEKLQLDFSGHVFAKEITFDFKIELGEGFTFIKDAFVNNMLYPGVLELRAGQWKRPFGREELTNEAQQAFTGKSITDNFFDTGRDLGVGVHNDLVKGPPLEYSVGLFGGQSDTPDVTGDVVPDASASTLPLQSGTITNVPTLFTPTAVARIGINHGDVEGLNELDTTGGPLRFALAVSGLEAFDLGAAQKGTTQVEVDGIAKLYGIDASGAVYLSLQQDGDDTFEQQFAALGVHAQAGYNILGRVHPGARYDYIFNELGPDQMEFTIGNVVLFYGQNLQWLVDGSVLLSDDDGDITTTYRARTELVLSF